MADIVNFTPAAPPAKPASPELAELRETWRAIEDSVQAISAILNDVGSIDDLTPDQRFRVQWDVDYLAKIGHDAGIQRLHLPMDEYRRRRESLMRSLGLGHLI